MFTKQFSYRGSAWWKPPIRGISKFFYCWFWVWQYRPTTTDLGLCQELAVEVFG